MKRLTVYLAGPIRGLDPKEAEQWRIQFGKKYSHCLDAKWPQQNAEKQSRKTGRELLEAIAIDERLDILNSDATIAYLYKNIESLGTAMGIMYAYLSGRTVVVVKDSPTLVLSKMIEYHSHCICMNFDEAVKFITERHNRSSVKEIIRRDGSRVPWNPTLITKAIQKAINNLFGFDLENCLFQPPKAEKLTEAVVMKIEDDIQMGLINKNSLDIETIQDTVEKILMANTHRDEIKNLVKSYIIYRKNQEDKRLNQFNDRDIHDFVTGQLHNIKSYVGNIGRSVDDVLDYIDNKDLDGIKREMEDLNANFLELKHYINTKAKEECDHRFKSDTVNLKVFVESVTSSFRSGNIEFHINIPADIYIATTPYKLTTVFRNLIENSIKHGFKGKDGNIFISARIVNLTDVIIDYWNDGADFFKENADRIFSGYKKGEEATKGSWQHGMSQSQLCIYQMGGSITCSPIDQSQIGDLDNPTFIAKDYGKPWFCITLRHAVKEKPPAKKILVADDIELHRKEAEKILKRRGYEILHASSIEEAEKIILTEELYGAVLDVDFREERNGLWLLKCIKEKSSVVKIAVLSAIDSESPLNWRTEAELNGAAAFDKGNYKRDDLLHYFDS